MNYPIKFVALIFCVCFPLSAWSQISYTADLEKLKVEHEKSLQAAADPVNRKYGTDLDNLLRKATQSGDLDTALKVKEEIKGLALSAPKSTANPTNQDERAGLVGRWNFREEHDQKVYWDDIRMLKADGNAEIESGAHKGDKGKWLLQGHKLVMHWVGNRTQTFLLPAVNDTLTGTTNTPMDSSGKTEEMTMKRLTQ